MQIQRHEIILIVVIITLLFLAAAGFILLYINLYNTRKKKHREEKEKMQQQFQEQILKAQVETQEATFSLLGQELHDNVCQLLNSSKLLIGVAQRTSTADAEALQFADETIGKAISEIRDMAKTLNKEWLQQFNLYENLQLELKRINASGNILVAIQHDKIVPFEAERQMLLFRVIQEALQNVLKHAKAKNVNVQMQDRVDIFTIRIADDGIGIQDTSKLQGVGILNMQHRVKLLGGQIEWKSETGKGTAVHISLPIKPLEHD